MNGSVRCETCEMSIDMLIAEGRAWTEITAHIPNPTGGPGMLHILIYYCGDCWQQQQARMFG